MAVEARYREEFRLYPYTRPPELDAAPGTLAARVPVVVVGAGPVGLAIALDLGLRGVPVLVLDDHEGPGAGSKAICFSKRSLEICDRLGAAGPMLEKGVRWSRGKVFHEAGLLYDFDLLPESGHQFPAFINLQQPWFEKFLHERIEAAQGEGAPITLRGRHRVSGVQADADGVTLTAQTPDGSFPLRADWLIACDGARSQVRTDLGLGFEGQVFADSFLIADVRMQADFPTERWFWFQPHFRSGDSALLHKQPDGIWRIDFQLGRDIDRQAELDPERIRARVAAMLGPDAPFELVWTSVYTFQCRRMQRFRHGRVLFAGDSAHQVSPFGARGANSGLQDADNLGWKLAAVLGGAAPEALLDSYDAERVQAADENILNSTRSTDFISPGTPASRLMRDAVLRLAATVPFARGLVNSGRLSVPCIHDGSALNTPDTADLPAGARPGSPLPDAPLDDGSWLLGRLGRGFTLLALDMPAVTPTPASPVAVAALALTTRGNPELRARLLGGAEAALYLIRPDRHVAARWTTAEPVLIDAALARALGKE